MRVKKISSLMRVLGSYKISKLKCEALDISINITMPLYFMPEN